MSRNNSVQAAQRRRASQSEPPKLPPKTYSKFAPQPEPEPANNKMTIPQAITLITLRLGALENKMSNMGDGDCDGTTSGLFETIFSRLDAIETGASVAPAPAPAIDDTQLTNLKQQVEVFKTSVTKVNLMVKENLLLKSNVDKMKREIAELQTQIALVESKLHENVAPAAISNDDSVFIDDSED